MTTKRTIYLDHAASTQIDKQVLDAMKPYLTEKFGNPSSLYSLGREAKAAIELSRQKCARILNCEPEEIVFTNGGTESDNLAVLGTARQFLISNFQFSKNSTKKPHIITSQIEHHAVLKTCEQLEKEGFKVTYLPVDNDGFVRIKDLQKAIKPETILVSIMYANNEIGTIEPIKQIGDLLKEKREKRKEKKYRKILFHTDACQAAGFLDLDIKKLGVDLLTLNGSKIYGPKGIGLLFKQKDVVLEPQLFGGSQENSLRPGTENVAGIIGLGLALEIAQEHRHIVSERLIKLRQYLIDSIMKTIPKVRLNGHPTKRLPNNVNVSILDIEGESLVLMLDEAGIAASTGSACTTMDLRPSHVILALGLSYEAAHGSLRLTLGKETTKKDIDVVLQALPDIVNKLRQMSPVNLSIKDFLKE